MFRISTFCLLLIVDAQLFSGLYAFQNTAPRGSWTTWTGKLQTSKAKKSRKFPRHLDKTLTTLLRDSSTGGSKVTNESSEGAGDVVDLNQTAATNTINERLLAELQDAEETEKFGRKKKRLNPLDGYGRPRKSDAEIKAAIAEARDLNGVNPLVAIAGSFFALGVAVTLWIATNKLGSYFVSHPPESEVYFVIRSSQVFRNVVMGLISLASGFFGVTGLGIFGMGVRVAYGVFTGELDPTPIQSRQKTKESVDVGKMMDLMMNKKSRRRGGKRDE